MASRRSSRGRKTVKQIKIEAESEEEVFEVEKVLDKRIVSGRVGIRK